MLVQRFRLFLRILDVDYTKAGRLIYAAVLLHNFLGLYSLYDPNMAIPDQGTQVVLGHPPGNTHRARNIRERFVSYLSS
jgi:hypothetical protein